MSVQQWKVELAKGRSVMTYESRSVAEEVAKALREVTGLPVVVYNGMTTQELEQIHGLLTKAQSLIAENRDANFFTSSKLDDLIGTAEVLIKSRKETETGAKEQEGAQECAS
jgi:hypothetical protein